MLNKIIRLFRKKKSRTEEHAQAHIIPRNYHNVSRSAFSESTLKVLMRLHKAGYGAYLVGGSIRDLLLGKAPKDFDIATDAHPEDVRKLFSNCILIGKRFRLAHVRFGREIIEVATFRSGELSEEHDHDQHGMILRDNMYGTIEQDAMRRDFTINALYYNIADFSLVDYVNGLQDIQERTIRLIGDPVTRYKEDPVRMLRAVRFAAKLDFTIEPLTAKPIHDLAYLLKKIPSSRLFEEYLKLFLFGSAVKTYQYLAEYGLLPYLFADPLVQDDEFSQLFLRIALDNTDRRVTNAQGVSPAFLIAVFLMPWLLNNVKERISHQLHSDVVCWMVAVDEVLNVQQSTIAIPRKFSGTIRDILELQYKLDFNRTPKKVAAVFENPRFRAGYDMLLLRGLAGEASAQELAQWWTDYMNADPEQRLELVQSVKKKAKPRRRRNSNYSRTKAKNKNTLAPVSGDSQ